MVQTKIDGKGRLLIPKAIRKEIDLGSEEKMSVFVKDPDHIIIERISSKTGREDSLDAMLGNPAHIDPKIATKEKLEQIEDEMWLS